MSDKIEYSRLLLKRSTTSGEVPTIPPITAVTLNQFTATDIFEGELFLNSIDDLLWIRTENGILPISLSGSTGSTGNQTLTQVLFEGNVTNGYDIEVSSGDTIIFQGIPSGVTTTILGLDASGNTITTTGGGGSQSLDSVLSNGNTTGIFDIVVSNGTTIQYINPTTGSTNTILGLDASGNTITTSVSDFNTFITGGTISYTGSTGVLDLFDNSGSTISITGLTDVFSTGGTYSAGTLTIDKNDGTSFNVSGFFTGSTTPSLDAVLAVGNTTGIFDIIISTGTTIQSPSGENEISLQDADQMVLKSTYTLGGNNLVDEIKMRAPSGTDAGLEIISTDNTNTLVTKTEYRPTSKRDLSFDSGGAFVETRLESSGYTIDLSNTSAGYLTIDGLLPGTSVDLLGLDSNNRVVPVSTSGLPDIYSTGGTFSAGTITINRNDGNSFNITGITAGVSSVNVGTGLSGNSTTGDITLINTAPDQVVSLSGGTGITTGGTYPNFTITNSLPDRTVVLNNGSNISVSGTYPNFTIASTGLTAANLWTSGSTIGSVTTTVGGNTNTAPYSLVVGTGNTVTQTHSTQLASNIVAGLNNFVDSAGSIVVGFNHNVDDPIGAAVFGSTNTAIPNYSTIFGVNNSITGGTFSFVAGGLNKINSGSYSAILGGSNNVLSSGGRSVILGGQGITGTSDNMVYVPNLTIASATTGSSVSSLGIDATGKVIKTTTPTDYYVTGGTFSTSGGTLTLERNDGNDVIVTGFTANVGCLGITIDGGGSAITTGVVGSIIVPYNCVIDCWGIIADQSGSIVIDVWKGSSPLSIPTSAAQSIAGSEKPTLSSQQINTDLNLTTWTKNLLFGDVLVFNVDSATTVERVTLQIKVIKL